MRLLPLALVAVAACDGSFSTPNGHPVPHDTAGGPTDTSGGSDTAGNPTDTRVPPRDTGTADSGPDATTPHRTDGWGGGGGECGADDYACTADGNLEWCDGGELVVADCATVCGDAGYRYTTGCGYEESYGGDVCWCDDDAGPTEPPPDDPYDPPAGCYEGWSCEGSDTLAYCDGQYTQRWSCDAYCQDQGYAYASACGYDPSYGGDSCFCEDFVCAPGEMTCSDGSCLDTRYVCDGVGDCSGGDDEWGCPATCVEGSSWCESGYDLTVCDGGEEWTYDCDAFCRDEGFDLADGCGYDGASGWDACFCAYAQCLPDEFQCDDGLCLGLEYTCDGYVDCGNGEDEYGCGF